jgi:hypothetical protein
MSKSDTATAPTLSATKNTEKTTSDNNQSFFFIFASILSPRPVG